MVGLWLSKCKFLMKLHLLHNDYLGFSAPERLDNDYIDEHYNVISLLIWNFNFLSLYLIELEHRSKHLNRSKPQEQNGLRFHVHLLWNSTLRDNKWRKLGFKQTKLQPPFREAKTPCIQYIKNLKKVTHLLLLPVRLRLSLSLYDACFPLLFLAPFFAARR